MAINSILLYMVICFCNVPPILSWYIIAADIHSTVVMPFKFTFDDTYYVLKWPFVSKKQSLAVYDATKGQYNVADEDKYKFVNLSGDVQLSIRNITMNDHGGYDICVRNGCLSNQYVEIIRPPAHTYMSYCLTTCILAVTEGRQVNLTCGSYRSDFNAFIKSNGRILAMNQGEVSYSFESDRVHSNISISCLIGEEEYTVDININYPVSVHVDSTKYALAQLDCIVEGKPSLYMFYRWEHMSLGGEHIRYLVGMDNGTLFLRNNTYEDTGIYVCTASNGIPDRNGQLKQNASAVFLHHGVPVFMNQKEIIKSGHIGKEILLTFILYSKPIVSDFWINKTDATTSEVHCNIFETTHMYRQYGMTTHLIAQEVLCRVKMKDTNTTGLYRAWARNTRGTSFVYFGIGLKDDVLWWKNLHVFLIIFGCVILLVMMFNVGCCFLFYKRRQVNRASNTIEQNGHTYDEIETVFNQQVINNHSTASNAELRSRTGENSNEYERVRSNDHDILNSSARYDNLYEPVIEVRDRPDSHIYSKQNKTPNDLTIH